jgi:hypothetical protein
MGREISYTVQVEEAVMDQEVEDKAVKGEDFETKSAKVILRAAEVKFILHRIVKEVRQTATNQTIKDYIIQLVQKSFRNGKDVANVERYSPTISRNPLRILLSNV